MKSITYIGMDVHTTNYTLCCYSVEDDRYFAEIEIKPDYKASRPNSSGRDAFIHY